MRLFSTFAALAVAVILTPTLSAIPIPLQSTGLGGVYNPITGGDVDPDWIITQITNPNPAGGVPSNCVPCAAAIVDFPNSVNPPGWVANDANSRWIWVNPQAAPTGFGVSEPLFVLLETQFTLPSDADLNSVNLVFRMAADDAVTEVRVNGVTVPGVNYAGFGSFSPYITINASSFLGPNPFQIGLNLLQFSAADNVAFGGFRVEVDGELTQYTSMPEPGTWAMLTAGFAGMAIAIRRKRAQQQ